MDVHIQKVKDLVVLSRMEVRPCRNHVWSIENPVMVSIIQVKEDSSMRPDPTDTAVLRMDSFMP